MIQIGTSGYSFADWVGPFYPNGTPRGRMLDYYARFFDVVEINATYYRIPSRRTFAGMAERTPGHFRFVIKAPRGATHDRRGVESEAATFFHAIEPIQNAAKCSGILFQFPMAFRHDPDAVRHLRRLSDLYDGVSLFAEFRHASWNVDPAYDLLEELGIGYCAVDEPDLPGLMPPVARVTSDTGYVRFHGRNDKTWWGEVPGDRYDHLYSESELREWEKKIREMANKTTNTFVFFNNCHRGQAVDGARRLAKMLDVELSGPVQGELIP